MSKDGPEGSGNWASALSPVWSSTTTISRWAPPMSGGCCCFWGVQDVRLLNGGWTGWTSRSYPIVKGSVVAPSVKFVARAQAERLAAKEQLLRSLKGDLQMVDARSENEYLGVEKRNNPRAGAIPGAKHLEWIDLIDRRTHRFKSPGRPPQGIRGDGHRSGSAHRCLLPIRGSRGGDGLCAGTDGHQRREQLLLGLVRVGQGREHPSSSG